MDDFKKKLKMIKEQLQKEEENRKEEKNRINKENENSLSQDEIDEIGLFEREMKNVRRLNFKNIVPKRSNIKSPEFTDPDGEVMHTLKLLVDEKIEFTISDTADYIEGHIKDIDPKIYKKLKKGEFSVEDSLDLHGKTKEESKMLVKEFIEEARLQSKRCLLIVHGKGYHSKDHIPVLKEALKNWLSSKTIGKHILAFCSASQKDGGTGAIYVLLRKN